MDWYLPGVSDAEPCQIHHKIWVRLRDGLQACPACMSGPPEDYAQRVCEFWPPDYVRWCLLAGRKLPPIPAHIPSCPAQAQEQRLAPHILSPQDGGRYSLDRALLPEQQALALSAQAGGDVGKVWWFLDGILVAEGRPERVQRIHCAPGRHEITLIDSRGRDARSQFQLDAPASPAAP
jgi:penicillin-binding protein 1C